MNRMLLAGLIILVGGVVAAVILRHAMPAGLVKVVRSDDEQTSNSTSGVNSNGDASSSSASGTSTADETDAPPRPVLRPRPIPQITKPRPAEPLQPAPPEITEGPPSVPSIPLPLARSALSWVGADPLAEAIWAQAINDPSVPPEARKDLIEDLNEEGFPDPKNLTADDLPLILSRIDLIEQFGPASMDEVNAAAFDEAYKDLLKMLERALQQ